MSRTPRAGRALVGGAEGACVRRASEGEPCSEHLPSTHRSFRSSEASERPGRRVAEAALKTISPRFHPGVSLLNSVECTYVTYRPAFRSCVRPASRGGGPRGIRVYYYTLQGIHYLSTGSEYRKFAGMDDLIE